MKIFKVAHQTQTEAHELAYVIKRRKVYLIDQGQLWELPVNKLKDVKNAEEPKKTE